MERYAVASGNWSNPATWDGGVSLPAAGDDVYANGFTVTIDQSVTVNSLRTTAGSIAVAGGGFASNVTNKTINVTSDITAGTSNCLSLATAGQSTIVNANSINGSSTTAACQGLIISATSSVVSVTTNSINAGASTTTHGLTVTSTSTTVTINATNVTGGASSGHGINQSGNNTACVVNATIVTLTGGSASNSVGFIKTGSGTTTLTVTNLVGGTVGNSNFACSLNGGTCTLNLANFSVPTCPAVLVGGAIDCLINLASSLVGEAVNQIQISSGSARIVGNLIGGSVANARPVVLSGGRLKVTGNVTGGSAANAAGVYKNGASTLWVVGDVNGGSHAAGFGIQCVKHGGVFVTGNCLSSTGSSVDLNVNCMHSDFLVVKGNCTKPGIAAAISNAGTGNVVTVVGFIEAGAVIHSGTGITDQILTGTGGVYATAV